MTLVVLLAATSFAAGVIHAVVVPEHLEEAWVLGVFFILTAGFQIAWAIALVFRLSVIVYAAGVLGERRVRGDLGCLADDRLADRSLAWMPEPVRALDVTATLLELLLVVGSLVLVRRRAHADGYDAGGDELRKEDPLCV